MSANGCAPASAARCQRPGSGSAPLWSFGDYGRTEGDRTVAALEHSLVDRPGLGASNLGFVIDLLRQYERLVSLLAADEMWNEVSKLWQATRARLRLRLPPVLPVTPFRGQSRE
jgi:hypothetical protein